jgi:hypothetical protein
MRTLLILLTIGAFRLASPLNADPVYAYAFTYELTSDASHNTSVPPSGDSALSAIFGFVGEPGDPLRSPLFPDPITVDGQATFSDFSHADVTFDGALGDPVLTPVSGEWVFSEIDPPGFDGIVYLTLSTSPNPALFNSLWSWTVEENGDPYAAYIDYGYQWSLDLVSDPVPGSPVPEPNSLRVVLAALAASSLVSIYRRSRRPAQ